ncbi:COX10 protein, partial [Acromyrmex heyeri]
IMLFIIRQLRNCRHVSCSFVPKCSVIMCSGFPRRKSTKTGSMEELAQTMKGGHKRIGLTTLVPFPEKNVVCKIEKDPCKIEKSERTSLITDYIKLHKHYLKLSKIKLTSLVVATTMAGYALAPAPFDLYTFAMCSLGTGLVSATANTINQFFEVSFDAQMSRTKNRVLVRGHLTPVHAIAFAAVSGIIGLSILYHEVNGITAMLGASNLILYTLIYTPMKRVSIANTWIGSVVGAIPPLMGWAGCCGNVLTPGAWILPAILYAWQFPHFNALSWNLRPDYSRAGYRMMAVINPDLCQHDISIILAWTFNKHSDSANSRRLFRFSLLHLPLLMVLILSSKKYWTNTDKQGDKVESSHNESAKKNDLLTIFTAPIVTSSV